MLDEFVSKSISSRVVIIEDDCSERKNYGRNLAENNEENNLHSTIGSAGMNESGILSGCIYTDVNKSRQNLYLMLIFVIHNLLNDNVIEDHNDKPRPVISYNLHSDRKPLNDWNNPDFFPIAFLALFFYRDGGNIALQSTKDSLYAWTK